MKLMKWKKTAPQNKSFLQVLSTLMRIQFILSIAVLVLFVLLTYRNTQERQRTELSNYTAIYASQIKNRMDRAVDILAELVYDNGYLDQLRSSDEATRQYAGVLLHNEMLSLMRTNKGADMVVVAEASQDQVIGVKTSGVTLDEELEIKDFAMQCAVNGGRSYNWQVFRGEEKTYFYRALIQESRAVLVVLSTETLLSAFPTAEIADTCFLLTDGAGNILDARGSTAVTVSRLDALPRAGMQLQHRLGEEDFYLYGRQEKLDFSNQGSHVILLFIIILGLLAFDLYYGRRTRQELLVPMEKMTRDIQRIQEGQLELRISTESDSIEFRTLVDAFNRLVDEIVHLKIESYEKQLALLDTEQKYTRLQIKPHFFLNAMSTIVGLNRAGKSEAIETYINALSKNIRYMFSSGLHTVPLQEEIRHVENYFEMQELKYPDGVLYFVDVAEDVADWPIPQMLIHTLVENEYKYAVTAGHQTMVLIKVEKVRWQKEEMLCIQVEDDGKGYPQEVLDAINKGMQTTRRDGTRVGLASIRRLLELMYDRENLFVLSNVEPHGAMSRAYIPARPLHETSRTGVRETDL